MEPPLAKRLAGKTLASHPSTTSLQEVVKEAYLLYVTQTKPTADETDEADLRKQESYDAMKQKGLVDEMEW